MIPPETTLAGSAAPCAPSGTWIPVKRFLSRRVGDIRSTGNIMARIAEFGVIPVFRDRDGRLAVQPQMIFPSEEDAQRAAQIFAEVLGGAVAFSRVADREAGVMEDGVIIGKYGALTAERRPASKAA
jgi:hypothetical protein